MSDLTKREQLELSSTLTNVEEGQDRETSSKLMEREAVENTPFFIVGNNVDGYMLTLGKYRVSPVMNEMEDLRQYMRDNLWNMLVDVVGVITETYGQIRKDEE